MAHDPRLVDFVTAALARGESRSAVTAALIAAGWERDLVDRALAEWADVPFSVPVPRPAPYVSAAEAFQYLVLFSTLFLVSFQAGALGFAFVDRLVPDPLDVHPAAPWVRQAVATLLIASPVFAFVARGLARSMADDPSTRQSLVRKWLTYGTLFIAASIVIGDLIALVAAVLGGDLTGRFIGKALIVGGSAGSIFWWFLADVRRDDAHTPSRPDRVALGVAGAAMLLAVVAGVAFLGSPAAERMRSEDARRLDDLMLLGETVDVQWSRNRRMPESRESLEAAQPNAARRDPSTKAPYAYRALADSSFELCATFAAPSPTEARVDLWSHSAGRSCFERPARYRAP